MRFPPSSGTVTPLRTEDQYRAAAHIDKAKVVSWQYTHSTTTVVPLHTMPCVAGGQSLVLNHTPYIAPLMASTVAGGVAHTAFIISDLEGPDNSDDSLRRIWATCLTAKAADQAWNARTGKRNAEDTRDREAGASSYDILHFSSAVLMYYIFIIAMVMTDACFAVEPGSAYFTLMSTWINKARDTANAIPRILLHIRCHTGALLAPIASSSCLGLEYT